MSMGFVFNDTFVDQSCVFKTIKLFKLKYILCNVLYIICMYNKKYNYLGTWLV